MGNKLDDWRRLGILWAAAGLFAGCLDPSGGKPAPRAELPASGLPVVEVWTEGRRPIVTKESYLDADIAVVAAGDVDSEAPRAFLAGGIRGRGNTSWAFPKKPYRVKFDEKTSLFGLEPAKSWVLLPNYLDPTLVMNTVAFELGNRFGLPFTHSAVHVELVLNGVHQGSYVLTEHKQVGKGRVDIDEEQGFFVEFDVYFDEEPKFRTPIYELPVMIKSPEDRGNGGAEGYAFVRDAIGRLESLLYNEGSAAPDPEYRERVDLQSFVDFMMVHEITRNDEIGHPKSIHMYMDTDSVIRMGPLWDFDWAYGIGAALGDGYFSGPRVPAGRHAFFQRFFDDSVFVARYRETWNRMKPEVDDMEDFIAAKAVELGTSRRLDAAIWSGTAGFANMPPGDTLDYAGEIARMQAWWRERVDYLDGEHGGS